MLQFLATPTTDVVTYLGNGTGSFSFLNSVSFNAGILTVADFNNDNKADLLTYSSSAAQVRIGNGAGSFLPPASYFLEFDILYASAFIGDYNNDTKTDFAVFYYKGNSTTLKMYDNDGSGNFTNSRGMTVSGQIEFQFSDDLNSDGLKDFVGYDASRPAGSGIVLILFGTPSGTLQSSTYFTRGISVDGIGDFNGDGRKDVLTSSARRASNLPGSLGHTVLYGNGTNNLTQVNKTFTTPLTFYKDVVFADFNADNKTDMAYSLSNWYTYEKYLNIAVSTCGSVGQTQIADYDGDSYTDFALWNPTSGVWTIRNSSTNTVQSTAWGRGDLGDIPAPGDYDGDGKTDIAVFRQPQGLWYILNSGDGSVRIFQWGVNGDKPTSGDYDGDGKTDVSVFRSSEGTWYIFKSETNQLAAYQFGISSDTPVQSDYDGDGKTDVAVYRAADGIWFYLRSSDGSSAAIQWGISTDKPVPEDYDTDGKADIAVFRPASGIWYMLLSRTNTFRADPWGVSGDIPQPGRYSNPEVTTPAIRRPVEQNFYYRADLNYWDKVIIGNAGDKPVSTIFRVE